ncbi:hypothetical protein CFN78_26660 [Amycolatopsis antarctica]|uniref:Prenyltransferase n=2 Tax=Amycolatopsis antarctica TaxID=1854586 RepID=A0A263CXY5_9PSEU|nr:hypothetical protein [Amycolatopsis antarctica]OZM70196.1 hypothetical protein CFN78_26660 [Amycolatopsis antarctica]
MATHARLLDRRRFELSFGDGTTGAVTAALAAYRNADGGYGSGLEPDLRSASSQPVAALHAFEVFEEIGPETTSEAARLCDWLTSITLPDGGLPFGLPIADPAGCAPFFAAVDPSVSSLHMTCMLAASAHLTGRHDTAVREHPWTATATEYSMRRIRELDAPGHALEFRFALRFLDTVHDLVPGADAELRRLAAFLPASGVMPVEGGAEGEAMHPLDFAPEPGRPVRAYLAEPLIEAGLDALAAARRADGGWTVDWSSHSPAGEFEWRGWATLRALALLRANGRV